MNDGSYGTYSTGSQIKLKSSIIGSSLCDYSDMYILVKGTIENTAKTRQSKTRQLKVQILIIETKK